MTQVGVIGAGMIMHDQVLPSLQQLRKLGLIGGITINARRAEAIDALRLAFPHPPVDALPGPYQALLARMPPRQLIVVATPDHLHFEMVMEALRADQHVLCVKPLVLTRAHSETIEKEARARGLFVGIEYHKRFDDRSLMARERYRAGRFGEFRLGTACLLEKWYYRNSNFQNWCVDAFTYIGCHYVDLVQFITGLEPVAVSVYGVKDRYPNGTEGYLWTDARVVWSNGAALNVQNAIGFPDAAPGSNTQGLTMYCSGGEAGAWLHHSDQYRGLQYCYASPEPKYEEPSPDYFQMVDRGFGPEPVGYGYRSIEAIVRAAIQVERDGPAALDAIEAAGIIATPANSRHNERVIEAARESLAAGGVEVRCA